MHRLSRQSSELTEVGCWCDGSYNYRSLLLPLCLLLLLCEVRYARGTVCCCCCLLLWVPLVATPKHENRLFYVHLHAACRLGKYCCCGSDKFARLVHRGVGGSPRMMVQQTRVVVQHTRVVVRHTRVVVQHTRVVFKQYNTRGSTTHARGRRYYQLQYYHGTIHKLFYCCCCPACCVVWCVIDWWCAIS